MTYDPTLSKRLVAQTDKAGSHATLAEVTLANQLSRANDAYTLLHRALTNLLDRSAVITSANEDAAFVDLQVRAEDYEAAYESLGKPPRKATP